MAEGYRMSLLVLFACVCFVFHSTFCAAFSDDFTRYSEALRDNRVQLTTLTKPTTLPIVQNKKPPDAQVLDLYCYENVLRLSFWNLWTSACFELSLKENRYEVYSGTNESQVFHLYETEASNWRALFSFTSQHICFSPFERACIGINTVRSYQLKLVVQEINFWLVGYFIFGVLLFLFAGRLSRSFVLYYIAGISVGVLTSILLICIIVGRLFTKKFSVVLVSLAAGGSLTYWFMKWLWLNIQMALEYYQEYLIGYLVCSSLLSFAVCYFFGPIQNQRLLDLIKWFLQGVAFLMIYAGIQIAEVSYTAIGILVIGQVVSYFRSRV